MASFEVIEDEGTRCVRATLDNETIHAERGALCYMFGKIKVDARLPSAGWMIKSMLSEESLIRPTFTGTGVVYLESSFGGFHVIDLGAEPWILESGSYWASEESVRLHVFRESMVTSFWAGDGVFDFQTEAAGPGKVVVTCTGPIEEIVLNDEQLSTNGKFVVARTKGISYSIRRAAKTRFGSRLTGDRWVRLYQGTGTILMSSYPYWRLKLRQQAGSD